MALIKCHECGSLVSNKAWACPKCGAPIRLYNLKNYILSINLKSLLKSNKFIGITLLICSIIALYIGVIELAFSHDLFCIRGLKSGNLYHYSRNYHQIYTDLFHNEKLYVTFRDYLFYSIGYTILGIILLWFAKKRLFSKLNNLYYILVIIASISIIGYNSYCDKKECEIRAHSIELNFKNHFENKEIM